MANEDKYKAGLAYHKSRYTRLLRYAKPLIPMKLSLP